MQSAKKIKKSVRNLVDINSVKVIPEPGGARATDPQYLADQITLFQPEEGRLSPPIITGLPKFFHLPASLIEIILGFGPDRIGLN